MSRPTTNQILNKSLVSGTTITDAFNTLRVTQGDGSGDMLRSVYDTDNDGKVDVANVAEAVPWTGVTGKPTLFPAQPYTHNHAISEVTSLQAALDEKQETLVSGDNIKSVNGYSLLGSGNITVTSDVVDHGALTGLTDDDHTQYHNDARGDARYSSLAHVHAATAISNTPSGDISATTVQAAINELDSEKVGKTGAQSMTGVLTAGGLLSNAGVIGYDTGSGGTVTQADSKSGTVTLNKPTGSITTTSDALAGGAYVNFVFYNSYISSGDIVHVQASGGAIGNEYQAWVGAIAAGVVVICLRNNTGASRSEVVNIDFAIFKRAAS